MRAESNAKNPREKKLDRRVKYTISALKEALITALQTTHISKISVKALCEAADVNRSTFYAHFDDQYDLLQHITQEALGNIQQRLKGLDLNQKDSATSFAVLNHILVYVKENTAVFTALLSDNCDPDIQRRIIGMSEITANITYEGLDSRTRDYYSVFSVTGCISILQKWLQDGTPESTEWMSRLILQVLGAGIPGLRQDAARKRD